MRKSSLSLLSLSAGVFLSVTAVAQTSRELIEASACGIQQALLASSTRYIIGVVEHPGRVECLQEPCTETLKIVKLYASRTIMGGRYKDATFDIEASVESRVMPRGSRSFVVAIPIQESNRYYLTITRGPVDAKDEREHEQIVKLAFGPPIGPVCTKSLPPSFRIQRSKD